MTTAMRSPTDRRCRMHRSLRRGVSLAALVCALAAAMGSSDVAAVGCSTSGSVTVFQCDSGGVNIQPNASGSTSLEVSGLTIPSGWINYSVSPSVGSGPISMLLTVTNTSVVAPGNGAVNVSSQTLPAFITVNLGSDVTLENSGGSGGVWIRNQVGGNIVVTSGATITSTGSDALTATSNAGSVSITNTGSVTSTDNRGIYADGSPIGGTTAGPVYVNNSGLVNAYLAGIRVIDYLGTASLDNSGTVTSTTRQGLVAWSQSGDVAIDNSGSVLARNYIGVQAMADNGNVSVVNSGRIEAERDTGLGPSAANQGISATGSADVSVTNTAAGRVIADSDTAILAETSNGAVTINNAGAVTGAGGVTATATVGAVSLLNSGSVTATSGLAVSLSGTTNRLDNTGTISTSGAIAVQTGNGDSTVVVNGSIAAGSALGTAVAMGSGNNRLVLADTAALLGKVTNLSSNNMLELTGAASAVLDLGSVGATGTLQGFANLAKSGAGVWTLTGNGAALSGGVTVEAGKLIVNGTLAASSSLTVMSGGTLGGSGVVPTTIVNGGTLSPGNSPGTLTVNGNLSLSTGSTYVAEIQGSVSDRVNVSGTASLAGTLRLVPLGGSYAFNNPYTLLSAAGGTSGTFSPVDTSGSFGAGVTTAVSYTANDVLLTLRPKPLGAMGSSNATSIASAIDAIVANGGDPSSLFGIYNLPAGSISAAVNSLSGEVHSAAPAMATAAADQFLHAMLDPTAAGRLAGLGAPGPGTAAFSGLVRKGVDSPQQPSRLDAPLYSVWGSAFGSRGRTDGSAAIGSARRTLDDAHLAAGVDLRLLPGTVAGLAVSGGKARASLPGLLGKVDADVFQAGLYGTTQLGAVKLGGALGYARLDNDVRRGIPALGSSLSSSYATTAWSGRLQASAALLGMNGFILSPLAAIQATWAHSPAVVEANWAGANAGALALAKRDDVTSRSEVGAQIDADTVIAGVAVTGYVRAAWAHYFQRDAGLTASLLGLPGASFAAAGARGERDSALLSAGVSARISERVSVGFNLDGEVSGDSNRLGGSAQIKVSF